MVRFPVPYLFENLSVCKILSWFTLIIEFALFTFVWFKPCFGAPYLVSYDGDCMLCTLCSGSFIDRSKSL
jgi:hypothetical protein